MFKGGNVYVHMHIYMLQLKYSVVYSVKNSDTFPVSSPFMAPWE